MKAEDMFKNIGYVKTTVRDFERHIFEDDGVIYVRCFEDKLMAYIYFDVSDKEWGKVGYYEPIDVEEHMAITTQMEELGWIYNGKAW